MSTIPATLLSKAGRRAESPYRAQWLAEAGSLFEAARRLGVDPVAGVSRESYGLGESTCIGMLSLWALDRGLAAQRDLAGNVLFGFDGSEQHPVIVSGSHADSVPEGGNFDGLAGIVAALLVLERLRTLERPLRHGMAALAMRGEESAWYGKSYLGSSAAVGQLDSRLLDLRNGHTGVVLRESMEAAGADMSAIAQGRKADWLATTRAYLELHIEQGPRLVGEGRPAAAVSGIRGNVRYNRVLCLGEAGHSGAVPREFRHDSVFAFGALLSRLDACWAEVLAAGGDLVMTCGIVGTLPQEQAVSRIPGTLAFSFEARSADSETLVAFDQVFRRECAAVAAARGVRFEFGDRILTSPARMDGRLVTVLEAAGAKLGLDCQAMASGAGHDAAVYANAGIPAAMLFVRNENGSHNPAEAMDLEDFVDGVEVLYNAVVALQELPEH